MALSVDASGAVVPLPLHRGEVDLARATAASSSELASCGLTEEFDEDVFSNGAWTRTDGSVVAEDGVLRIAQDGGYNDLARRAVTLDLPVHAGWRARNVIGGQGWWHPAITFGLGGNPDFWTSYGDPSGSEATRGWDFGGPTGHLQPGPSAEGDWTEAKVVLRPDGASLFAWSETGSAWSQVGERTWTEAALAEVRLRQHWDAWSEVDDFYVQIPDAESPTIDLLRPREGMLYLHGTEVPLIPGLDVTIVVGKVEVEVAADDVCGIREVEFFVDGGKVASDRHPPYGFSWSPSEGRHELTVNAIDWQGNMAADGVEVHALP